MQFSIYVRTDVQLHLSSGINTPSPPSITVLHQLYKDMKNSGRCSHVSTVSAAPFNAQLNVLCEALKLWSKLKTYGSMWSCSVFDLSYWHQQLDLIYQINPTELLTGNF